MLNFLKKTGIKLSLVTAIIATPSIAMAASGAGFMDASSESSSAALEAPTFEGQIARINIGINLIRLNTDIMERMPISADAEWVDKIVDILPLSEMLKLKEIREDAYYSTVGLTNLLLGRKYNVPGKQALNVPISFLTARLYYEASVIYKNELNSDGDFHIPDMNVFPDISDMKTYTTFKNDPKVEIIDIEASSGFYKNVVEAIISLLPEDLKEEVIESRKEMKEAKEDFDNATSTKGQIEAWLDDDKNSNAPEVSDKKTELEVAKVKEEELKAVFEEKEKAYITLLESGATALESNYDSSKVPLAKKLEKLLDAVDNNALGAVSMFSAATAGLVRGMGTLQDELKAIATAQQLTTLVGNQKLFLIERYERMLVGAVMAVPNISIGTYTAISQSSEIGKYQDIVNTILEGAKAEEEAAKASK